jgi:hypothetical protein
MNANSFFGSFVAFTVFLCTLAGAARAEQHNFYVTVDGRPNATGAYIGLPNPNLGRLTLLYAHWNAETPESNHFHGIGVYSYVGTPPAQSVLDTNANNRIPETFTGQAPLALKAGTGPLVSKLVSGETGEHYSDLTLYAIHNLAGDAAADSMSPEAYMYNSNVGYTNTPMTGLNLGLEIVAISPGLNLGLAGLNAPGQALALGAEAALPAEPMFWTEAGAAPGSYSASLRLVDQSGTYQPSGTFHFDFAVVPEPGAAGLAAAALTMILGVARRRRG